MLQRIRQSEFLRSVMVLMTGTVLAQLIAYLIYPLLTRIYSTEEMGELGMYTRIVGFVAAIATARYELTLPITKQDFHAYYLYRLSFRIAFVVLAAITLSGLVYVLVRPFAWNNLVFLAMTIISAYVAVWISLGTNWSLRLGQFRKISQQRIVQAVLSNGLRLGFGLLAWGGFGLIFATLIGTLVSGVVFIADFLRAKTNYSGYAAGKRMRVMAKTYRQFPMVNLPHVILDLGVDLLVAMLIVHYFDESTFGSYSHSYAMLRLPILLVGQSIGQVFFARCSQLINQQESIVPLLLKTLRTLLLLAIVPFTLLFFFGEELFAFVFSEEWRISGRFSEIMAPWLMVNFLTSPVSSLALVLGRQKEILFIGVISAIGQLSIFGLLPLLFPTKMGMEQVLWCMTLFQTTLLVVVIFVYIRFAKTGIVRA